MKDSMELKTVVSSCSDICISHTLLSLLSFSSVSSDRTVPGYKAVKITGSYRDNGYYCGECDQLSSTLKNQITTRRMEGYHLDIRKTRHAVSWRPTVVQVTFFVATFCDSVL